MTNGQHIVTIVNATREQISDYYVNSEIIRLEVSYDTDIQILSNNLQYENDP